MHDRTIDGEAFIFGNAGGLYQSAMTWWDHQTQTIWSQPIGEALAGELEGTRLDLLPSQITTWGNWRSAHPESFVMVNDLDRLGSSRERFNRDFVIGVVVSGFSRAYRFSDAADRTVLQDTIGGIPVLVWAGDGEFRVYHRSLEGQVLDFKVENGDVVDVGTGSVWNMVHGVAQGGALAGAALQPLPAFSSFDWAYLDFYPDGEIFEPE